MKKTVKTVVAQAGRPTQLKLGVNESAGYSTENSEEPSHKLRKIAAKDVPASPPEVLVDVRNQPEVF